jgi:hypothetical protein
MIAGSKKESNGLEGREAERRTKKAERFVQYPVGREMCYILMSRTSMNVNSFQWGISLAIARISLLPGLRQATPGRENQECLREEDAS